jgi:hypothetical protein
LKTASENLIRFLGGLFAVSMGMRARHIWTVTPGLKKMGKLQAGIVDTGAGKRHDEWNIGARRPEQSVTGDLKNYTFSTFYICNILVYFLCQSFESPDIFLRFFGNKRNFIEFHFLLWIKFHFAENVYFFR